MLQRPYFYWQSLGWALQRAGAGCENEDARRGGAPQSCRAEWQFWLFLSLCWHRPTGGRPGSLTAASHTASVDPAGLRGCLAIPVLRWSHWLSTRLPPMLPTWRRCETPQFCQVGIEVQVVLWSPLTLFKEVPGYFLAGVKISEQVLTGPLLSVSIATSALPAPSEGYDSPETSLSYSSCPEVPGWLAYLFTLCLSESS